MIGFDQHQSFPENLAQVPAVDFVDEEEVRLLGARYRTAAERRKNAVAPDEPVCVGLETPDEVFVRVALVELHGSDPRVVLFAR